MAFSAKILLDSLNPATGSRLTTMELTYPRFIHSEFLTHRTHSRNAASSRAIPIEKMIRAVDDDPVIPIHWGAAQSGMQARQEVSVDDQYSAQAVILRARDEALRTATRLNFLGLHKQVVNRYLEPWMWITIITSACGPGWRNLFALRCHEDAEPHFQKIARMAKELYDSSTPVERRFHLPLTGFPGDDELGINSQIAVSAARCARVSYLTHDGVRDIEKDMELHERLVTASPKHMSAFEHQAWWATKGDPPMHGNFEPGWVQYRKTIPGEAAD